MKTIQYDPALWQLVPKEPTLEMIENTAAFDVEGEDDQNAIYRMAYRIMLAAAPSAPERPLDPVAETLMRAGESGPDAIRMAADSRAELAKQEGLTDEQSELVGWIRWFLRNVKDPIDFRWLRMKQAADLIEQLSARTLLASQPDQYPLPDSLYSGSKDWLAGSYPERVEWLHSMYESAKAEVERLESDLASQPAPNELKLKYRAEGRAEALAILLLESPENPLSEFTSSSQCGGTGEWDTFWDEAALRERFSVDDATYAAFDEAEAAYWEYTGYKDEAICAANFAANMHNSGKVREVLSKAGEFDLMGQLCRTAPIVAIDIIEKKLASMKSTKPSAAPVEAAQDDAVWDAALEDVAQYHDEKARQTSGSRYCWVHHESAKNIRAMKSTKPSAAPVEAAPVLGESVDTPEFAELLWAFKFHDDVDGNVERREALITHIDAWHAAGIAKAEGYWKLIADNQQKRLAKFEARIAELEAAKGQGGAVAYADPKAFENFRHEREMKRGGIHEHEWMWANPDAGLVPLYTRPQPQVAAMTDEQIAKVCAEVGVLNSPTIIKLCRAIKAAEGSGG